jgi:thiosulfate dehydrogenase [quinone] large subunit
MLLCLDDHLEPTLEAPRPPGRERRRQVRRQRPAGPSLSPAMALVPLRLFLGLTFVYAGVQKLSDPGFLHAGAPTYIGTQLTGFANHTPGGFVLRTFAIPHAELAGIGVAIFEILLGLLVTFGLFTRLAAACGMALNLLLFLTASWHTSPYFLGPDIVFTFAWLPFVLAGAEGQPALDNVFHHPAATAPAPAFAASDQGRPPLTRRVLLAEMAAGALALSGIAALLKGTYKAGPAVASGKLRAANSRPEHSVGRSGSRTRGNGAPSGQSGTLPANAVELGASNRLPPGQAAEYPDPADGSADILIRESDGSLRAFSAICTHAGCTVTYQGGEIVCPCHGGIYSAQTGAVESGPPPSGLAPKKVLEQGGKIYAVPS